MKKTVRRSFLSTLVFVLLCAGVAWPLTTAEISGTVRDASGHPIANVMVFLKAPVYSARSTTNAAGYYAFVGIPVATYTLTFVKGGYQDQTISGVAVIQNETNTQNIVMTSGITTIAHVASRSATSLVQPNQTADETTVTQQTLEDITGTPDTIEQSEVLNALPGFTPTAGGAPSIRGGAINDLGYEMEGVDIKDPVLGLFMNNGALAGVQQLVVSTGSFDVATGNSNEGIINEVVKQGSYPDFANVWLFKDAGYFYDGFAAEVGGATPDNHFTWYVAYHGVRDANVWGDGDFQPLAVGATSNVQVNETVVNLFYRWGSNNRNQLQYFGETGYNVYDYNWLLNPNVTPYATNNRLVWASLASGTCNPGGGPLTQNCGQLVADTLPLFPGQTTLDSDTGYPDNENNQHSVQKLEWQHQFSSSSYFSFAVSKAFEYDNYDEPWAGGAFDDFTLHNASTNYGLLATYSAQVSVQHNVTAGVASIDERTGYLAQQNSLAAFTFFNDWCYVKAIATTPQFGCPAGYGTPLSTFPYVAYARNDPMHRNYAYIRDLWQPSPRWYIDWGLRWDNQRVDLPSDASQLGSLLNYNYGTGQYIQTLGPKIGTNVTDPALVTPRMFAAYTMGRDDVLRFGWGRYVDFAPELQLETKLWLPTSLLSCNIANHCFDPLPGYGVTNEITNLYQQSLYDFNTYFNSQFEPVEPQYVSDYEFSWEHDYGGGWQTKVTPYYRKGTNYVVGSQAIVATLASGAPLYGPYTWSNIGIIQSTGVELAVQHAAPYGLSEWLNLTYDNTMANYNSDYFPEVSFASVSLNHFYHVSYAAPITASLGIDYNTPSGFHAILDLPFESGYWYGVGKMTYIYENFYPDGKQAPLGGPGTIIKAVEVPNTNLINGDYAYYYVDPSDPGTFEHPNIVGSLGTPEGDNPGSLQAPAEGYINLTLAQDIGPNHQLQIGVRLGNLLGNFSEALPIRNPWYNNNGFGIAGPNSGVNPNAPYEPFQYNLGSGPYVSEPVGPERQILFFIQSKV